MTTLRFTPRAREDLLDIWTYIAEHAGVAPADRIYDLIENACTLLQEHPRMGRARGEIAHDARSIIIERWVALYRVVESEVQIVRIVDGVRDLEHLEWLSE